MAEKKRASKKTTSASKPSARKSRRTTAPKPTKERVAAKGRGTSAESENAGNQATDNDDQLSEIMSAMASGAEGLGLLSSSGLKLAMPMIESLLRQKRTSTDEPDDVDGIGSESKGAGLLATIGANVFYDLVEVASLTHPVYSGAKPYTKKNANGQLQVPHTMHILSLLAAADDLLGSDEEEQEDEEIEDEESWTEIKAKNVAYIAVAPGEYVETTGPLSPSAMRRTAMRERTYNPPAKAMLSKSDNQLRLVSADPNSIRANKAETLSAKASRTTQPKQHQPSCACRIAESACACSDGQRCACSCDVRNRPISRARYKPNGQCASLFNISCETRWRLRHCVKIAICDLLKCISEQACDNGKLTGAINFDECLEIMLCSLINCIPEALCPSESSYCRPNPVDTLATSCDCNFAVGEKS